MFILIRKNVNTNVEFFAFKTIIDMDYYVNKSTLHSYSWALYRVDYDDLKDIKFILIESSDR